MNNIPLSVDIKTTDCSYAPPKDARSILYECHRNNYWDHSIFPEVDWVDWDECKVVYAMLRYPMQPHLVQWSLHANTLGEHGYIGTEAIYPHVLIDPITRMRYVMGYGEKSKLIVVWLKEHDYRMLLWQM